LEPPELELVVVLLLELLELLELLDVLFDLKTSLSLLPLLFSVLRGV
jgi:hypothetical protein